MAKSGGVGPGGIKPQVPNVGQQQTQKTNQQRAQRKPANDAQRVAQQAGFHRFNKTKRRAFDIGDSSQAPIPMPDDDVDPEVWTQEGLDSAQENLAMVGSQLEEVTKQTETEQASMAEGLASSSFLPTEGGVSKMQELAERPAPEPIPMEEVSNSVKKHFDLDLEETVPMGHRLVATGLVVAGESQAVQRDGDGLSEKSLSQGLQKVTTNGNEAVRRAKDMSSGVNREVSLNRTFMFKR